MERIAIIGTGNVGSHLEKVLSLSYNVSLFISRTLDNFPEGYDMAIICVKDDVIEEVASRLKGKVNILCHTSGSTDMDILKPFSRHYGVIYPLQTFTKDIELDYSSIPFFIEASDSETSEILCKVAHNISEKVTECDSKQRASLHLASVFACNFTNYMAVISEEILENSGFSLEDLRPLMNQTFKKIANLDPRKSQTGPAVRNDRKIISKHLDMLKDKPVLQNIYNELSTLISQLKN